MTCACGQYVDAPHMWPTFTPLPTGGALAGVKHLCNDCYEDLLNMAADAKAGDV